MQQPRPRLPAGRGAALRARGRRVQRGLLRPRRRSSSTTSRGTSSSATSSTTTPTSTRTSPRSIEAFRQVVALVPPDGAVVINADDAAGDRGRSRQRARRSCASRSRTPAPTSRRGTSRSTRTGPTSRCSRRACRRRGSPRRSSGATTSATRSARSRSRAAPGLSVDEIARALPRFAGVRRRLEIKGEKNGILVVDDFAHHPTAVAGTLAGGARALSGAAALGALRAALEHRRPQDVRGGVRRRLRGAPTRSCSRPSSTRSAWPPDARLDREALVRRFAASAAASRRSRRRRSTRSPRSCAARRAPGDVLLLMSSGAFGGLPETLLGSL